MRKVVAIIVGIMGLLLIFWLIFSIKFLSWDFRNNLWAPAYLLLHGESAYDINILFVNSNAIWFPQIIGVFFPLGLLSQYQATNIWLIINIIFLIILVWYLFTQVMHKKPKPLILGFLALTVFLFPPTIRLLILGQVDVILVISLIAGAYAIERHQITLSGFLFALALVKPQLCLLVLPSAIGYLLLFKREWRFTLKLLSISCLFGFALTIPLWLSNSNWVSNFLSNLQRNPQWSQPAIFSQLSYKLGTFGLVLWFFLFTTSLVLSIRLWSKYGPTQAVLWSLALTTIVSPYVWSWDFILFLPLFIDTAIRLTNTLARATLLIFYAICFVLSVISLKSPGSSDSVLWWFPFVMMIGIIISLQLSKKYNRQDKVGYAII